MYLKSKDDMKDAPEEYLFRIKTDTNEFIYHTNYTKLAKELNCSLDRIKGFIGGRKTIPFHEYYNFNLKR